MFLFPDLNTEKIYNNNLVFLYSELAYDTLTALTGGWGAEDKVSFLALANSMDDSDGLFEPLVAGETNPVFVYQIQNIYIK